MADTSPSRIPLTNHILNKSKWMAAGKESKSLARLTPDAIVVKTDAGEIRVPTTKEENKIMNLILVSQVRTMIQGAIKKWSDDEETPNPRELRDLVASVNQLCEASSAIWVDAPLIPEKPASTPNAAPSEDVNFDNLTKVEEIKSNEQP